MKLRWKDFLFETDKKNADAIYAVCFLGEYDPLLNVLGKDDIVLDAGANIGAFSIAASRIVKKVYAVEPHPLTYKILTQNLRLNKCENVYPINSALSNKVGESFLEGYGESAHLGKSGINIKTTTIDSISSEFTAIKMDIEGAEIDALKNQKSLEQIKAIGIETHNTNKQITEILSKSGFYLTKFQTTKIDMIRKASSLDFFLNELRTNFTISKRGLKFLLNISSESFIPTGILYGFKNKDRIS